MQHTVTIPPLSSFDPDVNPVFSVVIAYEDLESGKQAKQTYDFLAEKVGPDCRFTNQMWKFDVLGIPNLRDIAVKDAAMADIIIVSCQGDALPIPAKSWIESWASLPVNAMALIALLGGAQTAPSQSAGTRAYLAGVAKRARMEFFAQPQRPSARNEDPFHFNRSVSLSGTFSETMLPPFFTGLKRDTSVSRWGINE